MERIELWETTPLRKSTPEREAYIDTIPRTRSICRLPDGGMGVSIETYTPSKGE